MIEFDIRPLVTIINTIMIFCYNFTINRISHDRKPRISQLIIVYVKYTIYKAHYSFKQRSRQKMCIILY